MGIGAPLLRLAAPAWCLATVATAFTATPLAPVQAACVGGVALLALRWPLPVPVLAIAAAPLWLCGLGLPGALEPAAVPAGPLALALLVLAPLLALGVAVDPPRPWAGRLLALVGGIGLVESLRAGLLTGELPGTVGVPVLLATGILGLLGALSLPEPRALAAGAVLLGALGQGLHSLPAWRGAPESSDGVYRAARLGLLAHHGEALVQRPALGLLALRRSPRAHAIALGLLPRLGAEALLDVGWQPSTAPLDRDQRRDLALLLDRRGQGGEALRLLWRRREDPLLAWTYALLARSQGNEAAAALVLPQAAPPEGTPRLPGTLPLAWTFVHDGARSFDLQVDRATDGFQLLARGDAYQGPALLEVQLDGGPPLRLALPTELAPLPLALPLTEGPHRLVLRFVNDLEGPGGDRNVEVLSVSAP